MHGYHRIEKKQAGLGPRLSWAVRPGRESLRPNPGVETGDAAGRGPAANQAILASRPGRVLLRFNVQTVEALDGCHGKARSLQRINGRGYVRFRDRYGAAAVGAEDVADGGAVIHHVFAALVHSSGAKVDRGQTKEEDRQPAPHETGPMFEYWVSARRGGPSGTGIVMHVSTGGWRSLGGSTAIGVTIAQTRPVSAQGPGECVPATGSRPAASPSLLAGSSTGRPRMPPPMRGAFWGG